MSEFQKFSYDYFNIDLNKITEYNFFMEIMKEIENLKSFKEAINNGISVVDFFAPWCSPCKAFSPIFEQFAALNKQFNFIKIDIDAVGGISNEYAILSIPTCIAFKNGKEIARKVGLMSAVDFKFWLNDLA